MMHVFWSKDAAIGKRRLMSNTSYLGFLGILLLAIGLWVNRKRCQTWGGLFIFVLAAIPALIFLLAIDTNERLNILASTLVSKLRDLKHKNASQD